MTSNEFERLNTLSEKALNETASRNEMTEFNELLNNWNSCGEFNLMNDLHSE